MYKVTVSLDDGTVVEYRAITVDIAQNGMWLSIVKSREPMDLVLIPVLHVVMAHTVDEVVPLEEVEELSH